MSINDLKIVYDGYFLLRSISGHESFIMGNSDCRNLELKIRQFCKNYVFIICLMIHEYAWEREEGGRFGLLIGSSCLISYVLILNVLDITVNWWFWKGLNWRYFR